MATTVTKTIGTNSRDYSTISGWEADTDNDLVTADEVQVGECYADSEFDERPAIAGATTDSTRFRLLKAANGEEHTGVAGTGVIIDWTTGSGNQGFKNLLNVNEAFARVEHLEVTHTNTFSDDTSSSQLKMVKVGHADAEVHRLLVYEVRCADFSQPVGIECNPGLASNCIVWDATSNTGYNNDFGAIITRNGGQAYNCTVHDWNNGGSDAAKGFFIRSGSDVVKNCYAGGTEKDFELDGSISPTLENNASSDSTADDNGGTGHLVNKSPSNQFVDVSGTPPNRDYHLQASADLVDAGQDLGDVRAAIDIDTGNRHDQGVTWDIGADEEGVEGVTPVSNDHQSPQEALQGLAETRESSQEAIGTAKQSQESAQESLQPLTATVQSAFEALDSLAQSQQSAQEARQGLSKDQVSAQEAVGVAKAALTSVYEALSPVSSAAQAVHEALQGLSQDRTSVQEAGEFLGAAQESVQEAIRLGLSADSVLLFSDAADGLEPAFGGDWQYARDSVAYFLDGRGLFTRMAAHSYMVQPVEVNGTPWLAARIERAGVAENADTTDFSASSDWSVTNISSREDAPSVVEGELAQKFTASAAFLELLQTIGTLSGSEETVWAVIERGDQAKSSVALRDLTKQETVARADYDWGRRAASFNPGTGLSFSGEQPSGTNETNGHHIEVPSDPALHPTTTWTFEGWLLPRLLPQSGNGVSLFDNAGGAGNDQISVQLISSQIRVNIGGVWSALTSSALTAGSWHHIAVVYDNSGGSGDAFLYVNGVLEDSTTGIAEPAVDTSNVFMGRRASHLQHTLKGKLDDVRLWNVARSQTEVQNNKDAELSGGEAGLVAYWPMNDGFGLTVRDKAGSFDGTLTRDATDDDLPEWAQGQLGSSSGSSGAELLRERGPNGGRVVLLWARGTGSAGNTRQLAVELAGDSEHGFVHAVQEEEQPYPSSLIVSSSQNAARATADIEFEGAAVSDHLPAVVYARIVKDFDGKAGLTEPRVFQIGENDPGGADGAILFASHEADGVRAGYRDAGEQQDATVSQSSPAGRGDALEVLLWVRADGSGRLVVMTNEDDTAEGAEWATPASLEELKNRLSLNATPDGQEKGSGRYMEIKVLRGADFVAQPDGSQDRALIEEAAKASVTSEGRFWERPR